MAQNLLQTKLHLPSKRPQLIPRARLLEQITSGRTQGTRLTLIAAPAGFGKTTVAAAYAQTKTAVGWLSLNENEGDPHQFLRYLLAAIQNAYPQVGAGIHPLLDAPQPPAVNSLLPAIANELTELAEPLLLVLDDYHTAESATLNEIVSFLLTHTPPNIHMVLTSRREPALPLARWRVRGELTEIGAAQLRFTAEETAALLQSLTGTAIDPELMATLAERTEGWAAALQLAAVGLKQHTAEDTAAFVQSFSGSHRYLVDYLVDEVLAEQPAEMVGFLLETAVLERFTAELCDAVRAAASSRDFLIALETQNLFLVPLDHERQWYRYHHLFAELLQTRLAEQRPEQITQLHERASHWLGAHGHINEALHHALAAGAPNLAADWVVQSGRPALLRGEFLRVKQWLKQLPDWILPERPDVAILDAIIQIVIGGQEKVSQRLTEVERALQRKNAAPTVWAEWRIYKAHHELSQLRTEEALSLCQQATAEDSSDYILGYAAVLRGIAYRMMGQPDKAIEQFNRSLALNERAGNLSIAIGGALSLAEIYEVNGQLTRSEQVLQRARPWAMAENGRPLPFATFIFVGLAKLYRERDELDKAEWYLQEALALGRLMEMGGILVDGQITLGLLELGRGAYTAALGYLDGAEQLLRQFNDEVNLVRVGAFQARVALAQGDQAAAVRWAKRHHMTIEDELNEGVEIEYLTLARILLAEKQPDATLLLLQRLQTPIREERRVGRLIETLVLQAAAYQQKGENTAAQQALTEALLLGEPERFVRIFADEGEAIGRLLQSLPEQPDYVKQITAAIPHFSAAAAQSALIEPLTEREEQILQLIAVGRSNKQIAEELILSLSTVKWYTSQIYGKLGVSRRTEAVERGRGLGLL